MIRQDYILRLIEQCLQTLQRIRTLFQAKQFSSATEALDQEFQKFLGSNLDSILALPDTVVVARLMNKGSYQEVRNKCALLVTLLREAGSGYTVKGDADKSYACHLKALNLMLATMHLDDATALPSFVPQVDELAAVLKEYELPVSTQVALMRHYEQIGAYAKAEDCLASLMDAQPQTPGLVELGLAFYRRLLAQSDASLIAGNLPRPEVEAALQALTAPIA
jgi:hypothetical protein